MKRGVAHMSLDEVGRELGLSRERIRQIERDALRKLRLGIIRLRATQQRERRARYRDTQEAK